MTPIAVLFVITITYVNAQVQGFGRCLSEECFDVYPRDEVRKLNGKVPSEAELTLICPPMQEFFFCLQEKAPECSGKDLLTSAETLNGTDKAFANLAVNTAKVVADICTNGSDLHKAYVSNVECFRSNQEDLYFKCSDEADEALNNYFTSKPTEADVDTFDRGAIEKEWKCLRIAYTVACATVELTGRCSVDTSEAFLEVMRKSSYVKNEPCSGEDYQERKTQFLNSLNMEEGRKKLLTEAFNAIL